MSKDKSDGVGSFKAAFSVEGFSQDDSKVNMNKINMSLDQESMTFSDADYNIDETPLNHEVLSKMNLNTSYVDRQQINDPSKFVKSSQILKGNSKGVVTSQGMDDNAMGIDSIVDIAPPNPNVSPQEGVLKAGQDDQARVGDSDEVIDAPNTHREVINVTKTPQAKSGLKTKKSTFTKDPATVITSGVSRKYTSRRSVMFDDNDSNGEDDSGAGNLTGNIQYKDTQGKITTIQPNPRFAKYSQIFTNLLKQNQVITRYPIQNMIISYDSQRAIVITTKDDEASYITQFSIQTQELTFEEKIGYDEAYIKVKECVQNSTGQQFACCFFDDGKFRMRIFGKEQRKRRQIQREEIRFNELFGLDDYTMSIDIFPDPFITCCFTDDQTIFVSFFHNYSLTHYHFLWDIASRRVIGVPQVDENGIKLPDKPITRVMDTNSKNFPYKCFYSTERDEIYCVYRQGQIYTIKPNKLEDYRYEKVIDRDLGQMELLFDQALVVRSSSKVLFFKQIYNEDNEVMEWQLYNSINIRGFIYFIRGNVRIQITTDQLIYFYLIDQETFEPQLENVMYNYMMCNQMMIGAMKRYSITFKQNERSFDIYQRKYMHNLRVCVDDGIWEGSKAVEIAKSNLVLISKINQVIMFDNQDFTKCGEIPITLLQTETREPNEVIGMVKSLDEDWVAIISGKNLIMNEQKQNQLFIFKKIKASSTLQYDSFVQEHRIVVKDLPIFQKVCMEYHFKIPQKGKDPDTIIFAKPDLIFELNFVTSEVKTVVKFDVPLLSQPLFFSLDVEQQVFVIASNRDGIYINLKKGQYIDLDELYKIDEVRQLIYDLEEQEFYILTNQKEHNMGFFLLKFQKEDPNKNTYLTNWEHNLDIGDANMYISRGKNENGAYKELICGYKTVGINIYNTVVLDIASDSSRGRQTLQRHEANQLWESPISGLLLEHSKDYLTFSRAGINILALGTTDKKPLKDNLGMDKVMHSLDSVSYLKVDPINYINFRCQDYNNRVMSIEQEWSVMGEDGVSNTYYDEIYKIKIHEVTLRELLILQSFYISRTTSDIIKLIKMQPDPRFFYKTFLELGGANFCSILSFDSSSMNSLLAEENEQYFSEEYPIIYKNKMMKKDGKGCYYTNAIENALKNNQVKAVNLLISYIVKYQNNFVSSYLFLKNIPVLMEKGISLHDLFDSKVFSVTFDFDMWPGNHNDDEECIRAYNGSYFDIRQSYNKIFPDFIPLEDQKGEDQDDKEGAKKVAKIKYSVNLLAQASMYISEGKDGLNEYFNEDVSLMTICGDTEELEVFETDALQQVIQFKWDKYGKNHHLLGCIMHLFYSLIIIIYVKQSYLVESDSQVIYAILIAVGILYPTLYEMTQLARGGCGIYLSDMQNQADLVYIYGSIGNIVIQLYLGPFHIASKILMCVIVLLLISKTFFFLRIFPVLTPIVVMITNVIYDLRIFLLFYLILIALFCQIFAILGLGSEISTDVNLERMLKAKAGGSTDDSGLTSEIVTSSDSGPSADGPAKEYQAVGLHLGEFLWTFRLSLGDFSAVGATGMLTKIEMQIFWLMWMMTVIVTCIIFLNFVVAEACASYSKVVESLESIIQQAQAILIAESEEMMMKRFQTKEKYPRYLIYRGTEN